ncbi:ParB/Srx family N-terminal domain-containing protein [Pseudoclavibacter soli]|uniref:ParB/Srx family N-terminal domain-containing protein n=1 Tax=Pseudoclavibacter soli TaxID=452623 RepID=UPI00040B3506|nr:ParB/Srx family N-terminal domain-containing protein [Pseudoclavibacter soli]
MFQRRRPTTIAHRALAAAAIALLTGGGALLGPVAAQADALAETGASTGEGSVQYLAAQADDLVDVRISDVHPTQPSLGYDEVYYKLGRYTLGKDEDSGKSNKKFDDWCETNGQGEAASVSEGATLADTSSFSCEIAIGEETEDSIAEMKTVVIGPGGTLYLTDGHHTLTSFAELTSDGGEDIHVRLKVLANLSDLSSREFWQTMVDNKWTWLKDASGNTITPAQLPTSVGLSNFQNDEYRSLLYFGRDIGYEAGSIPFQEFYWGDWLANTAQVDIDDWDSDAETALATVESVTEKQVALAGDEPVSGGFTASALGVLSKWNNGKNATKGEFGDLAAPYSESKPGKIAYMLQYRAALQAKGINPDSGAALITVDASRGTLVAPAQSSPGATVTVSGTTNTPEAVADIELHSDPIVLATVVTDDHGAFSTQITLPNTVALGTHELVATVAGQAVTQTVRVALTDPPTSSDGTSSDQDSAAVAAGDETTAVAGAAAASGEQRLAATGTDADAISIVLALGMLVVTLGVALVVAARCEQTAQESHDVAPVSGA